jgi:hypothetical protein
MKTFTHNREIVYSGLWFQYNPALETLISVPEIQ